MIDTPPARPDHSAASTTCPSCGRLTILTIAHAYEITLYDPRTGSKSQRVIGKRQCLACGGGDVPDRDRPNASDVMDTSDKHDQPTQLPTKSQPNPNR